MTSSPNSDSFDRALTNLSPEQRHWLLSESARRGLHPLQLAQSLGWPLTAHQPQSLQDLEAGQALGRFVILSKLGSGGMGVVYAARSKDPSDPRRYALKLLTNSSPEALARFEREALTMARLSPHRNVVRIDALERSSPRALERSSPQVLERSSPQTREPSPMIVMEYISGGSLEARLKSAQLSIDEVLDFSAQIADALAHLHAAGVVHRDLKPANVLLRDGHEPALTDFGVARASDLSNLTKTQEVVGTPHYMAPEQLDQGSKGAGPTTDIWALGVMLYEMATGRRPFEGESLTTLAAQIAAAEPPDPRSLDPKLPRGLAQILARALAKNPQDRYPAAALMAEDLRALRRGEPLSHSRPSWFQAPLQRLKAPGLALSLTSIALAGLAGMSVLLLAWQRQIPPELLTRARSTYERLDRARARDSDNLTCALAHIRQALPRERALELGLDALLLDSDASQSDSDPRVISETRELLEAASSDQLHERALRELATEDQWQSALRSLEFHAALAGRFTLPSKDDWSPLCQSLAALRKSDLESAIALLTEASPSSKEARAAASFARVLLNLLAEDPSAARTEWNEQDLRLIAIQCPPLLDDLQAALNLADCFSKEQGSPQLEQELTRWAQSEALRSRFALLSRRITSRLTEAASDKERDSALRAFERVRLLAWHAPIPRIDLEPAAHKALAEQARRKNDRGAALFHIIQAHRHGREADLPDWARTDTLEGELVNVYSIPSGTVLSRSQEALALMLDMVRAGLVQANAHRHFLINLYKTGVVETALTQSPNDYALRSWRSEALRQMHSEGTMEATEGQRVNSLLSLAIADAQATLSWDWASPALRARTQAGLARLLTSRYGLERRQEARALLAAACAGPLPRRDDVLIQTYELAIGQDQAPALRKILDEAEAARRERHALTTQPELRNQRPVGAPISTYSSAELAEGLAEIYQYRGMLEASAGNAELAIECFVRAMELRPNPSSQRSFVLLVKSSGRIAQGEAALPRLRANFSPQRTAKILARWHGTASEPDNDLDPDPPPQPKTPSENSPDNSPDKK